MYILGLDALNNSTDDILSLRTIYIYIYIQNAKASKSTFDYLETLRKPNFYGVRFAGYLVELFT